MKQSSKLCEKRLKCRALLPADNRLAHTAQGEDEHKASRTPQRQIGKRRASVVAQKRPMLNITIRAGADADKERRLVDSDGQRKLVADALRRAFAGIEVCAYLVDILLVRIPAQ